MSEFDEVKPRAGAASELRNAIRRAAHEVYGAKIVEEPVEGYRVLTTSRLNDPLAGVRAARLTRDVAEGQMLTYAEEARGAGRSWDEVAQALGSRRSEDGEPRDAQAYLLLIEGRPLPGDEPSRLHRPPARWTCTSYGQQIADRGPFESHPDDSAEDHASSCLRRTAAPVAYSQRW